MLMNIRMMVLNIGYGVQLNCVEYIQRSAIMSFRFRLERELTSGYVH
jgi:hypothetical protein